ncbi:hypothetical protein C8R45DRAFT_1182346 [Mycena sanguinolenta]|nr:hypothetical protein C8R45DRAFT_1182346 [Mycena sanguinolenta]
MHMLTTVFTDVLYCIHIGGDAKSNELHRLLGTAIYMLVITALRPPCPPRYRPHDDTPLTPQAKQGYDGPGFIGSIERTGSPSLLPSPLGSQSGFARVLPAESLPCLLVAAFASSGFCTLADQNIICPPNQKSISVAKTKPSDACNRSHMRQIIAPPHRKISVQQTLRSGVALRVQTSEANRETKRQARRVGRRVVEAMWAIWDRFVLWSVVHKCQLIRFHQNLILTTSRARYEQTEQESVKTQRD